jgi:hypothetical protein
MTLLDPCSHLGLCGDREPAPRHADVAALQLHTALAARPHQCVRATSVNIFYRCLLHALTSNGTVVFACSSFRMDVLWPSHSYLQPKLNLAGAVALYFIVLVLISSMFKKQIGRLCGATYTIWSFLVPCCCFCTACLRNPSLKDGHPDLLDGRKVFIEISLLISVAATAILPTDRAGCSGTSWMY